MSANMTVLIIFYIWYLITYVMFFPVGLILLSKFINYLNAA